MQASTTNLAANPAFVIAESWLVRGVTAAGVALFGDKVFTSSVAINVAGVATAGLAFAINEVLHYFKTNKRVVTAVASVDKAVASDPALAASLAQLSTSLKTLESHLQKG